jgi:hypothetical protein
MGAGLVHQLENWEFSPFKDYCGQRNRTLCNQKLAFEVLKLPPPGAAFYEHAYRVIQPERVEKLY